jgi:hypothetical protein
MINYELKIDNNILIFNRILTNDEKNLNESELILLDCYLSTRPFLIISPISYTKEEINNYVAEYQKRYFDEIGLFSLMNIKTVMMLIPTRNSDEELILQMILAIEKWINKLWSIYTWYKTQLDADIQISSIILDIAEPPCKFYDIAWVSNLNNYRSLEPNRIFNMDVNYYINYTP